MINLISNTYNVNEKERLFYYIAIENHEAIRSRFDSNGTDGKLAKTSTRYYSKILFRLFLLATRRKVSQSKRGMKLLVW